MKAAIMLLCLIAAPALAQAFLARIPDVPLMTGLREQPEAGFVFDKPSGRIVEAVASGAVEAAAVSAFYTATLAQLGWRALHGTLRFEREDERLVIAIEGTGPRLTVRFSITPKPR